MNAAYARQAVENGTMLRSGPVEVVMERRAQARGSEARQVAFAMLRVTGETPISWQLAVKARQDADETGKDEVQGYGVDVGLGSFAPSPCPYRKRKPSGAKGLPLSPTGERQIPAPESDLAVRLTHPCWKSPSSRTEV